jgi:hypothetical protein
MRILKIQTFLILSSIILTFLGHILRLSQCPFHHAHPIYEYLRCLVNECLINGEYGVMVLCQLAILAIRNCSYEE